MTTVLLPRLPTRAPRTGDLNGAAVTATGEYIVYGPAGLLYAGSSKATCRRHHATYNRAMAAADRPEDAKIYYYNRGHWSVTV